MHRIGSRHRATLDVHSFGARPRFPPRAPLALTPVGTTPSPPLHVFPFAQKKGVFMNPPIVSPTSATSSAADDRQFSAPAGPRGLWALGMALMGRLKFPAKAALISLAFLIPLVFLAVDNYVDHSEEIAFTTKERQGVAHLQAFAPALHGLIDARNATRAGLGGGVPSAAADYTAARQRLDAGLAALDKLVKERQDPLGVAAEVAKFKQAFDATASSKDGTDGNGRTVFGPVTKAAAELIIKIGDNSNLALDPDLDSFYLINGLLFTMPKAIEDLGQLWGWGAYAIGKSALSDEQLRTYAIWVNNLGNALQDTKAHFGRSVAHNPALGQQLKLGALDKAEAFRTAAKDPNELVVKGTAATSHYADGKAVVADAMVLYTGAFTTLDGLLAQRESAAIRSLTTVLLVAAIMAALACYLFVCFYKVTHDGLSTIGRHLDEMSHGDLRHRPAAPWASDEPAELARQLATTYDSLYALIRKVRHGARELHTASNEIASASADLAARTEASAAALEEQASAMEEIGSTVGNTAQSAQAAAQFATGNAEVAEKAGDFIQQVVHTMQEIHASSSKINDIIGVIDGIAFQTNILALNAAVEAARAGEAGRGFAVVAAEVRQLAQRSAGAAKEIKGLISDSVDKIDSGTRVVQGAGSTMTEVVTNAKQINSFLGGIATSAKEQASGVEQVGQSIQELDRSTQQNAALVEETTSAAAALRHQAELLQQEIANFRVV